LEHQIDITIAEHGRDPENGDALLGAFEATRPGIDVVIDQNVQSGQITATFFLEADSVEDAVQEGILTFATAATAAGFEPSEVTAVSVAACTEGADAGETPELVPA
jgi:hypothetical protein